MTHSIYNKRRYPHFVCNHGAWDIYADSNRYCVAIPVDPHSGHKPSHFGDADHVRRTLNVEMPAFA